MLIDGVIQASEFAAGVGGTNRQQITLLTGPFLISPTFGVNPIGCLAWRWASALNNQTYIEVGTQTLLQKRNLVTPDNATNFPAASNVRSGITYGIGGVVSGTCIVPNPAQVAAGTPVDNTVGTLASPSASDIATAVWGAANRTITGGTVDTLTNAPDVPTEAEIASAVWSASTKEITGGVVDTLTNSPDVPTESEIAAQVRTELSVELGRIDQAVSSRLAASAYTAPSTPPTASAIADEVRVELASELANLDAPVSGATAPSAATVASQVRTELTAELAKVSALNTDRLANVATTAIVGNLIAQAQS
jgi:hypothetical protein